MLYCFADGFNLLAGLTLALNLVVLQSVAHTDSVALPIPPSHESLISSFSHLPLCLPARAWVRLVISCQEALAWTGPLRRRNPFYTEYGLCTVLFAWCVVQRELTALPLCGFAARSS